MTCPCNLPKHSERRFCCASCHRAFSSMTVFDWHRTTAENGSRTCRDPELALRGGVPLFVASESRGITGTVAIWGQPGPAPDVNDHQWRRDA